jgi:hypothetical protein
MGDLENVDFEPMEPITQKCYTISVYNAGGNHLQLMKYTSISLPPPASPPTQKKISAQMKGKLLQN